MIKKKTIFIPKLLHKITVSGQEKNPIILAVVTAAYLQIPASVQAKKSPITVATDAEAWNPWFLAYSSRLKKYRQFLSLSFPPVLPINVGKHFSRREKISTTYINPCETE